MASLVVCIVDKCNVDERSTRFKLCELFTSWSNSHHVEYSGTSLYRLPMGQELATVIERWLLYEGGIMSLES